MLDKKKFGVNEI